MMILSRLVCLGGVVVLCASGVPGCKKQPEKKGPSHKAADDKAADHKAVEQRDVYGFRIGMSKAKCLQLLPGVELVGHPSSIGTTTTRLGKVPAKMNIRFARGKLHRFSAFLTVKDPQLPLKKRPIYGALKRYMGFEGQCAVGKKHEVSGQEEQCKWKTAQQSAVLSKSLAVVQGRAHPRLELFFEISNLEPVYRDSVTSTPSPAAARARAYEKKLAKAAVRGATMLKAVGRDITGPAKCFGRVFRYPQAANLTADCILAAKTVARLDVCLKACNTFANSVTKGKGAVRK